MIKTAGGTTTDKLVTRTGYGDFPDNTDNWTILLHFKYDAVITGGKYASVLNLFDGSTDFTTPYLFLGSQADTDNVLLELYDGITFVDSTVSVVVTNTQYWAAITYNNTTHITTLIIDGAVVGTVTLDMSSVIFDGLNLLGDGASGQKSAISVAYCRAWSSILTGAELTAEVASITAVKTSGLIWDCPLQASIDLTSHNNTLNQFSASGTVTTDTDDPLLSIISAPPTNTTPATAITVSLDSAYFQDMLSGGAAVPSGWYKIAATISEFWGAIAYGDAVTYTPDIRVFEGLANANANVVYLGPGGSNQGIQFSVTGGNDYYFQVARNGAVTPATNQVSVIRALSLPVPIGSIMINDDARGFICAMDVNTGYPIHFFNVALTPVGEGGCPQNNGTIVICQDLNTFPVLYDAQFNLIAELNTLIGVSQGSVSSNLDNTFAIGTFPLGQIVRLVDNNGLIDPTIYDVGGVVGIIGLNVDASKFYYSTGANPNLPIKTWNILTNSAGPNLLAAVATERPTKGPIIVLQNGTILSPRTTTASPAHFIVKQVTDAGVAIQTIDLGPTLVADNRIATDPADPIFFWAWGKQVTNGFSFFNKIKVSDGSLIVNLRDIPQYENGFYTPAAATPTPWRFGHSESCPFWINRVLLFAEVADASGLYILTGTGNVAAGDNPVLTHDVLWVDSVAGTTENVAIPNPFGEGFLVGDE